MNKLLIALIIAAPLSAREPVPAASGHWEGTIQLPKKVLRIDLDLAQNGKQEWIGSLYFRGLDFDAVRFSKIDIHGASVSLLASESVLAVEGTLSADGTAFEGGFSSAFLRSVPAPVRLSRVGPPEVKTPLVNAPMSAGLEGSWEGVVKLNASWEDDDPRAGSTVPVRVMLKPGAPDISNILQSGSAVHFEVKGAGAVFTGELKGDELTGRWTQFDADPVPLSLRRR